jgi:dolichol-phosphate mannosyltransferase
MNVVGNLDQISAAVVIPSYNEIFALPVFLLELTTILSHNHAVIVMDDSEEKVAQQLRKNCYEVMSSSDIHFIYNWNGMKCGRGAAVRRGFELALQVFPNLVKIIECDADLSHQVSDIQKLDLIEPKYDLIIGSRYLPESRIIGWPINRRIFSRALNLIIPKLFGIPTTDITNGLRLYSKLSIEYICTFPQKNTGFIYLTESLTHLSKGGFKIFDVPTTFVNRTLGESTVRFSEIKESLQGVIKLLTRYK